MDYLLGLFAGSFGLFCIVDAWLYGKALELREGIIGKIYLGSGFVELNKAVRDISASHD